MPLSPTPQSFRAPHPQRPPTRHVLALLALWLVLFFAALFSPPLLDDADSTHAQAARAMLVTGDWVTLHVDGIRYLEKPPLPYWLVALSFRLFGFNTFAVHLPLALAVLALTMLGYLWARQVFDCRTALYTGLATLTCTGVFLFTRIFIPEVLLSLFLCLALYAFLRALELATGNSELATASQKSSGAPSSPGTLRQRWVAYPYIMWTALALAVLTKGFVALVFFFGTAALYLALTRQFRLWRSLRPFSGLALFLLIAAPWHVLASLRNTGGENGHGFLWFYFINEHVLRFLGRRIPRDYNKLPFALYWSLHLVWLFPWSLFAPVAAVLVWRRRRTLTVLAETRASRTILLLGLYSALVLLFFSFSTNQEYYTFPAYLPLLLLICAALVRAEHVFEADRTLRRCVLGAHVAYTVIGLGVATALAYGLWSARAFPFVPDIGDLLAHRGVGDYTLSMSHFFDLTGPSFAALRLPATLALFAFALGPIAAWTLRRRRKHLAATLAIALTSALFLIAAHIALDRFAPMLSSKSFADKIEELADDNLIERDNSVLIFGDQSFGSSIPFYLDEQVELVDGRSTSMEFGSTFPDAPPIFLTPQDLLAQWGHGRRKLIFVPAERRLDVDRLLGPHQIVLEETSGKVLLTDRPLNTPTATTDRR
ncbi:MAG: glycosyltransferase family 39 protein [Acidobacteriaceae bacterium]